MTKPTDGCENLAQVSDSDWLAGHNMLMSLGVIPNDELGYLYEPGRDPATVSPDELTVNPDKAEFTRAKREQS